MTLVAGHQFDLRDRCFLLQHNGSVCPTRWLDIHDADQSCVGKEGWAHTGCLNDAELRQIHAERERRSALFDQATNQRAGTVEEPEPGYLTMWGTQERVEIDVVNTEEF